MASQTAEVLIRFRQTGAEQLGQATKKAADGIKADFGKASLVLGAGAAGIAAGLVKATQAAGDFEQQLNIAGSVAEASGEQVKQLGDLALKVGQDTVFSAQEAAEAITALGKAGISIPNIMGGAAMAAADLAAAAGDIDMPRAAEVIATAMNTFRIAGEDAGEVADSLAGAANASAASINDLAFGLAQVGAAATGLNVDLEDTLAALAIMIDRGLQGSDAGTSLKTMFARLTPATKPAKQAFRDLGFTTDDVANKFFDAQGEFLGLENASQVLYDGLKDLSVVQRENALEVAFGSDAGRAARLLFLQQKDAVEAAGRSLKDYRKDIIPAGQATKVAEARMKGMNGALEQLRGSFDTMVIILGQAFTPIVETLAEKLTDLVNFFVALPTPIQRAVSILIAGTGALLALGAAIAFVFAPAGAALAGVATAIGIVMGPLLALTAALGALFVAYKTNFLGFADGVNKTVNNLKEAFRPLVEAFQSIMKYLNDVTSTGKIATNSLGELPGSIRPLAHALGALVDIARDVIAAFGRGGIDAAFEVLQRRMPRLQNTFGRLGEQIRNGIGAALHGIDWGDVATTIWNGLKGGIAAVPWQRIGDAFRNLDQMVTKAFFEMVQGINWSEVGTRIDNHVNAWWAGVVKSVVDVGPKIDNAVNKWANDLVQRLRSLGPTIDGAVNASVTAFEGWAADLLKPITALGPKIDGAVNTLIKQLAFDGRQMMTAFYTSIQNASDTIFTWFGELGSAIEGKIGDFKSTIEAMKTAGGNIISGLLGGMVEKFQQLTTWISGGGEGQKAAQGGGIGDQIYQNIVGAITKTKDQLLSAGALPIQWLLEGAQAKWTDFTDWFWKAWNDFIATLPSVPNPFDTGQGGQHSSATGGKKPGGGGGGGNFEAMGGAILPRAAMGRAVMVGERGPEVVTLPFGSYVTPHGASMGRDGGGGQAINFYGNVTFQLKSADVADEVYRQIASRAR